MIFARRIVYLIVFLSFCFLISDNSTSVSAEAPLKAVPPSLEEKVLGEINSLRKRPQTYVWHLWDYRKAFDGNNVKLPSGKILTTKEGLIPVNEAIRELNDSKPIDSLELSGGLSKAAKAHLDDLIKTNTTGHTSSDGTVFDKRLEKFGKVLSVSAENIAYDSITHKDIVLKMIVDDGTANRGHRKNLLNPKFRKVGIATGKHPTYGTICVVVFADGFVENRGRLQVF